MRPAVAELVRLALTHTTRVAIAPIETAAAALWPEADCVTILEEALSADRAKSSELTPALKQRITAPADYATVLGAEGVLFTCSAFGEGVEEADRRLPVPVLKPYEAMFEAALNTGPRAVLLCTFAPAAGGMEAEYLAEAGKRGITASVRSVIAEDALAARHAGDGAAHDLILAQAAAQITGADVILLGQFSMARAANAVRVAVSVPFLTSPEAAIQKLKACVAQARNQGETHADRRQCR